MKNSRVTFNLLDRDNHAPVCYKQITCQLIFNVKIDLPSKARYVAGGHLTDPTQYMTYDSVFSRDSVRLAFLIAKLNYLDILSGDIQNAYLNALTKQKVFFYAGDYWRNDQGKVLIIIRALYGLNSSSLVLRHILYEILYNHLGLQSSLSDTKVWFKAATDSTRNEYYTYIIVYVDDLIIVDKDPQKYMSLLEIKYIVT